jgi:hypothetical protein
MLNADGMEPYVSQRGLVRAIVVLLWAHLVALGGFVIIDLLPGGNAPGGPLENPNMAAWVPFLGGAFLELGVRIAIAVCFLVWIHRAYRNLPALGAQLMRFTPGWAVGWWFVPIAVMWRGYQVTRELWILSQPAQAVLPTGERIQRRAPLLGWWWAVYLISTFKMSWLRGSLFGVALEIASTVLFMMVVVGIEKRQAAQHADQLARVPVLPPNDLLR